MTAPFTRRDFLKWASLGAGASAVGGSFWLSGRATPATTATTGGTRSASAELTAPRRTNATRTAKLIAAPAADLGRRKLVVIELGGGNDGLSTLVPYGLGRYYDLRTATSIPTEELITLDDEFGVRASFAPVVERGLAVVQGVGSYVPDGSHFEMMRRWWAGDETGRAGHETGFLGRLADAIGDPGAPAVALSIGSGPTPALVSAKVATLALPSGDAGSYVWGASPDDTIRYAFQQGLQGFAASAGNGLTGWLQTTLGQTIDFAEQLSGLTAFDETGEEGDETGRIEYPGGQLGDGLRLAARVLAADAGTRIVHVPMRSDFDTHEGHGYRHASLMDELAAALDAFHRDLDRLGIGDQVVVMTTSEFGRRAPDNGSGGLDHGAASVAFVTGPVNPGRHGEHPSLTDLDENENLRATVSIESYYATIAEGWFGVPAGDVLGGSPEVLGLFN